MLAVYNGGAYLKQSVASVLEQDLNDFELLVLDDCSTDNSYEWVYGLQDTRIKLFRNETNRGLFYNLNFLIEHSNSSLIKLWSQDDIMYPHCLSSFVKFHSLHPEIGFSYSGRDMIDENGIIKENHSVDNTPEIISPELHARIAYYTGSIAGNIANVCISKQGLNKVGVFDERMKISADFDMWVRLAEHFETGFIRLPLIQLRNHSGQLSRNPKYYINHVKEDLEVYKKLNSYCSEILRNYGKKVLRNNKFVFYYTLMIKEFIKGRINTAYSFAKVLSSMDNLVLLTFSFIKNKLIKQKNPFKEGSITTP